VAVRAAVQQQFREDISDRQREAGEDIAAVERVASAARERSGVGLGTVTVSAIGSTTQTSRTPCRSSKWIVSVKRPIAWFGD
jgi:hypothetical protein